MDVFNFVQRFMRLFMPGYRDLDRHSAENAAEWASNNAKAPCKTVDKAGNCPLDPNAKAGVCGKNNDREANESEGTVSAGTRAEESIKDGYLQYLENGLRVRVDLKEGETRVGRSNNADCSLDSEQVQNQHAKFIRERGVGGTAYYVQDMSSGAGTYVNGNRIPDNKPTQIYPGFEIRLADVKMTFMRRPSVELMEQLGSARLGVK